MDTLEGYHIGGPTSSSRPVWYPYRHIFHTLHCKILFPQLFKIWLKLNYFYFHVNANEQCRANIISELRENLCGAREKISEEDWLRKKEELPPKLMSGEGKSGTCPPGVKFGRVGSKRGAPQQLGSTGGQNKIGGPKVENLGGPDEPQQVDHHGHQRHT